jgi:hypothetical protein
LFCLPYWLGYAPLTFSSAPSGGVLYPGLLRCIGPLLWTAADSFIIKNLPQPLELLAQSPGPMLAIASMGGLGPVAVTAIGIGIGAVIFLLGYLNVKTKAWAISRPR